MRRTPTTDILTVTAAEGAATGTAFDVAYHELAAARAAYDDAAGDPEQIAVLAEAASRLEQARHAMRRVRAAA